MREGVRGSRINLAEPVPPESFADPPEWLSESARAHWDRLAEQVSLMHVGPFSCDRDTFLALVTQADTAERLSKLCVQAPVLIRNRAGEPVPTRSSSGTSGPAPRWSSWLPCSGSPRPNEPGYLSAR
jgi:hypothetical protein